MRSGWTVALMIPTSDLKSTVIKEPYFLFSVETISYSSSWPWICSVGVAGFELLSLRLWEYECLLIDWLSFCCFPGEVNLVLYAHHTNTKLNPYPSFHILLGDNVSLNFQRCSWTCSIPQAGLELDHKTLLPQSS